MPRTDEHVELIAGHPVYQWREDGRWFAEFNPPIGNGFLRASAESQDELLVSVVAVLEACGAK